MNEFKDVLNSLITAYEELVFLLQREREALVTFNPDNIEQLSREKDITLMKIKLFDEERVKLLELLSKRYNEDNVTTLSKLVEITKDEQLKEIGLKLISLIQSVFELNEFNKILIERSSKHVSSFLCFLDNCRINHSNDRKAVKA